MGWIQKITTATASRNCAICGNVIGKGCKYERNSNPDVKSSSFSMCLRCKEYIRTHTALRKSLEKNGFTLYKELEPWLLKYKNEVIEDDIDQDFENIEFHKKENCNDFTVYERREPIKGSKDVRIVTLFFDKKKVTLTIYSILYGSQNLCVAYTPYVLDAPTVKASARKLEAMENSNERYIFDENDGIYNEENL